MHCTAECIVHCIVHSSWWEAPQYEAAAKRHTRALGVHGEDFVQVTWYDDGCEAVRELRIVGDQVTRDE